MNPAAIEQLLNEVRAGRVAVAHAVQRLRAMPFEDLGFASDRKSTRLNSSHT